MLHVICKRIDQSHKHLHMLWDDDQWSVDHEECHLIMPRCLPPHQADCALNTQVLQDEMNELVEREEQEAVTEKEAAEAAAHLALMQEANLEVHTMLGGGGTWQPAAAALEELAVPRRKRDVSAVPEAALRCGRGCSSILLLSLHSSADRELADIPTRAAHASSRRQQEQLCLQLGEADTS